MDGRLIVFPLGDRAKLLSVRNHTMISFQFNVLCLYLPFLKS